MIKLKIFILTLLLGLAVVKTVESQSVNVDNGLSVKFVKKEKTIPVDKVYLNVFRIHNTLEEDVFVEPQVILPQDWTMINSLTKVNMGAGSKKPFPIRVVPSKSADALFPYPVVVNILNDNGDLLSTDTSFVLIDVKSDWSMEADVDKLFFPKDSSETHFHIRFINKGNRTEKLRMKIGPRPELIINNKRNQDLEYLIDLKPQKDTLIRINLEAKKEYRKENFKTSVWITTFDGALELKEIISVTRLDYFYDNYQQGTTNHKINLKASNYNRKFNRVQLKAGGNVIYSEKGKFDYNVNLVDLLDPQYMQENNVYSFKYAAGNAELGFGNAGIGGVRSMSFENSFFGKLRNDIDSFHVIESSVSYNPFKNQSVGSVIHKFETEDHSIENTIATSNDQEYGIKSQTAKSKGKLKLNTNNRLEYKLSYIQEDNSAVVYGPERGYAQTISLAGKLRSNLTYMVSNIYGTDKYPGSERGVFSFRGMFLYLFPKSKYTLHSTLYTMSHDPVNYSSSGTELQRTPKRINNYALLLSSPGLKKTRFSIGPQYIESRSAANDTEIITGNMVRTVNLVSNVNTDQRLWKNSTKVALGINDKGKDTPYSRNFSIESKFMTDYFNLQLKYKDGIRNTGASSNTSRENSFSVAPAFKTKIGKKFSFDANSSFNYNFTENSGRTLVSAQVSYLFKYNWSFNINSSFNMNMSEERLFAGMEMNNLTVNLTKGIGEKSNLTYYDIELYFFKDDNSNGLLDDNEEAIENMLVQISRTGPVTREGVVAENINEPVRFGHTALASNDLGKVHLTYMPEGFYELKVSSLENLKGYFNFSGSTQEIKVTNNVQYYFPYEKAGKIYGKLKIIRDKFSRFGIASPENIRITARTFDGKEYTTLTGRNGNYSLYVPQGSTYIVEINNPFGSNFNILKNQIEVDLTNENLIEQSFIFKEKGRKIKLN